MSRLSRSVHMRRDTVESVGDLVLDDDGLWFVSHGAIPAPTFWSMLFSNLWLLVGGLPLLVLGMIFRRSAHNRAAAKLVDDVADIEDDAFGMPLADRIAMSPDSFHFHWTALREVTLASDGSLVVGTTNYTTLVVRGKHNVELSQALQARMDAREPQSE